MLNLVFFKILNMEVQTNNLSTFRVLFIIKGILTLLFSLFFVAYALFGVFIDRIGEIEDMEFNPSFILIIIGAIGFTLTLIFGILTLVAAKYINETRNFNFIFVMAILNCLTGILGILLGVFTIVELNKPHIKALFEDKKRG